MRKLLSVSILGVVLGLCAGAAFSESTLDKVKKSGEMLAGVRSDNPPMAFRDEKGEWTGFAVDLAQAVAQKLGVKAVFVPTTAQTRTPLLTSGRIDAEFGSTTPTKQREEVVDFTITYNWDTVVPLVRKGESKNPADYKPPKKVSSSQGNFAIPLFQKIVPNAEVVWFPEFTEAVVALLQKKVDAVMMNKFAATSWSKKYAGQLDVGDSFFEDPQAIMVREDDSKWRKTLNWTLQELWAEGKFAQIYQKYFGYAPEYPLWSHKGLQPGIVK
ncbi:MAG TPA: transporter substrate-binding domain-containing protein [Casimicrobiaceae bacterium]|nr:transporter substrate-binding domain-containing protein [Casimicrobiaceae bacterium]